MKNVFKGLLLCVAALLMTHSAYAQSCYQYSGPLFTTVGGVYTTSDHVTATLILTSPITSAILYTSSSPFPAPSFLTMNDGVQTLDTAFTPQNWTVEINLTGSNAWDVFIAATPLQNEIEATALINPREIDWNDAGWLNTRTTDFGSASFALIPPPNPFTFPWILQPLDSCALAVVKSLNADIQTMGIPILGPLLSDTLLDVTYNIASLHQYQACEVIRGFDILVELGEVFDKKNFTATQANALLSASKSLQYVLGCGPGI